MRYRVAFGVLAALLCAAPALSQTAWRTFSYPDKGFAIDFPAPPQVSVGKGDDDTLSQVQYLYSTPDSGETLGIARTEYVDVIATPEPTLASLVANAATGAGCKTVASHPVTLAGSEAVEAELDGCAGGHSVLIRFAIVGTRLYDVLANGPAGFDRSADARRFVGSLTLTPQPPSHWLLYALPPVQPRDDLALSKEPFSKWSPASPKTFDVFAACRNEGEAQTIAHTGDDAYQTIRFLDAVCFNPVTKELRAGSRSPTAITPPIDVPGVIVDEVAK